MLILRLRITIVATTTPVMIMRISASPGLIKIMPNTGL